MIPWHNQDDVPAGPETAVIAIEITDEESGATEYFLLAEMCRWDVRYGAWMTESGGLLLRQKRFRWARETDILETLSCR